MENNYDFWFWLNVIANIAQLESYEMNKKQISNDQIMRHLENQDIVLNEQTEKYLKSIEEKLDKLLKRGDADNDYRRDI